MCEGSSAAPASSTPDSSKVSRTAAHTSARARSSVDAELLGPALRRRARPRRPWCRSRAGRRRRRGRRTCRRRSSSRPAGAAGRPRARRRARAAPDQHDGGGVARLGRLPGAVGELTGERDEVVAQARRRDRDPHAPGPTSTMISTSTGASRGSTGTPTAERACTPASPKTSPSSSEAPLATFGWPVKSGVRGHEADHLDHARDGGEVADLGLDGGDRVQRALPGAGVGLLLGDRRRRPCRWPAAARAQRQLAGGDHQVAGAHRRDVGGHRGGHLGHDQAEAGEDLLGVGHRAHSTGRLK